MLTDVAELVITKKVGSGTATDADTRNRSLTAMRKVLIDSQNVMVAVGGKMHSKDGFIPGVGEEMQLAEKKGIPQFLIGGLGGFARKLAKDLTPPSLRNSLSRNRKWINYEIVRAWDDGLGVVGIYIHGLKNLAGEISTKGNNPFDFINYGNTGKKLSSYVKCYDPVGATSKDRYDWISTHLANAVEEAIKIRNDI